jgi:hypothetical protein
LLDIARKVRRRMKSASCALKLKMKFLSRSAKARDLTKRATGN